MRGFKPLREHFIPKGATKFADRESSAVVYAYENDHGFYLIGFHGRAQKPDFHFRYGKNEKGKAAREAKARESFNKWRAWEGRERAERVRNLKVGDILRCSWGYEQTNVDYYEVTALVGKSSVEIREIACASVETLSMQGKSVPLPGSYKGEPMVKRAQNDSVKIANYAWARRMEPTLVGGVKTYEASHWTAYY